jgi:hypothetical protein
MMPGTNFPTFIQLCLKNDIWVTSVRMILLAFQTPWLREKKSGANDYSIFPRTPYFVSQDDFIATAKASSGSLIPTRKCAHLTG